MRGALWAIQFLAFASFAGAQHTKPTACPFDHCGVVVVSPGAAVAGTTTGERRSISWMFVPHISALDSADDPAHLEYRRAQRLYGRSSIVQVIGMPAILGVVYYVSADPQRRPWRTSVENAMLGVSIGTTLLDAPLEARAAEHLSRAAWAYSRPAGAQLPDSSGCTYDRCALRFSYHTWSSTLVQGLEGAPVTSPRDLFTHASDSAHAHYERYLALQRDARRTGAFVLTSFVGAVAALHARDATVRGIGVGFLIAGYAVGHLSLGMVRREHEELDSAVWEYNRALAR
jgi:hypothetical protein